MWTNLYVFTICLAASRRRLVTRQLAPTPELLALSQLPASSSASPSEGGICGPVRRSCEPHTIRIGGRALGILQWWVTWKTLST
jgi:hypothetical protein